VNSAAELYVYYRVAASQWRAAGLLVRGFQQRLCRECPGLRARVLRRPGERSDGVTLMEIYAFDDGRVQGIDEPLRARIDAAAEALSPLLASPRQVEVFEPLD
jgi:hypothetical protein